METNNTFELETRFDSRASFYGKARVEIEGSKYTLFSYNTKVAYIEDGKAHVLGYWSTTTMRHIREFLKQNDFEVGSKKEILKDYGVNE